MPTVKYPRIKLVFSTGTYSYSTFVTKRKIAALYTIENSKAGVSGGTCRVEYSSEYYNEFQFTDLADLMYKVSPCIEKELMNEFTKTKKG